MKLIISCILPFLVVSTYPLYSLDLGVEMYVIYSNPSLLESRIVKLTDG